MKHQSYIQSSPRHICFWTRGAWGSVLTIRACELGRALVDLGWRVSYIVDSRPENLNIACDHASSIIAVPSRPFWSLITGVRKALADLRPDYVHILNPSVSHYLTLRSLSGVRLIGDWEDCHPVLHPAPRRWIDAYIERWGLRRADVVIAVSKHLQKRFRAMGREDVGYVPYAVLPRAFPEGVSPYTKPHAVWMGSLQREAELRLLIQTAAWLRNHGHPQQIMIIGGGSKRKMLEDAVSSQNLTNLTLAGRLPWDDMLLGIKHAHLLLLPLEDNEDNRTRCPFKAFQYAQAGRPIAASLVGEVQFILGTNAIYTEFSAEAFGRIIVDQVRDPMPAAVSYSLEHHTWADRANRMMCSIRRSEESGRRG